MALLSGALSVVLYFFPSFDRCHQFFLFMWVWVYDVMFRVHPFCWWRRLHVVLSPGVSITPPSIRTSFIPKSPPPVALVDDDYDDLTSTTSPSSSLPPSCSSSSSSPFHPTPA